MEKIIAVIGLTNTASVNILDIDTDTEKVKYRINNGRIHNVKIYVNSTGEPYFMYGTTRMKFSDAIRVDCFWG